MKTVDAVTFKLAMRAIDDVSKLYPLDLDLAVMRRDRVESTTDIVEMIIGNDPPANFAESAVRIRYKTLRANRA